MTLKKMVDGVEVECGAEEEASILAVWAANDAAQAQDSKLNGYKYNRAKEYPLLGDQLDMLWHSMDSGEIPKSAQFYQAILAIKSKYPKPQ